MLDVPDISIVVPVYGSDGTLVPLYERLVTVCERLAAGFEIIFVDDCGPGDPWEIINQMAKSDHRVKGLKLSRNFGQHNAIKAGLDLTRGRWIVVMDCDLQDRPEEIPRFLERAMEGHDVVIGRRVERRDGFLKRLFSDFFHRIFRLMTDHESDTAQANFAIYSRRAVDTVINISETPAILPLLVRHAGYEIEAIDIEHCRRAEDKSGYTFSRRLSLAMDILIPCSDKPLRKWARFWFLLSFAAVFCAVSLFIREYLFGAGPPGRIFFNAFSLSIYGLLFLAAGAAGIYVRMIYNSRKEKPMYIVKERTQAS